MQSHPAQYSRLYYIRTILLRFSRGGVTIRASLVSLTLATRVSGFTSVQPFGLPGANDRARCGTTVPVTTLLLFPTSRPWCRVLTSTGAEYRPNRHATGSGVQWYTVASQILALKPVVLIKVRLPVRGGAFHRQFDGSFACTTSVRRIHPNSACKFLGRLLATVCALFLFRFDTDSTSWPQPSVLLTHIHRGEPRRGVNVNSRQRVTCTPTSDLRYWSGTHSNSNLPALSLEEASAPLLVRHQFKFELRALSVEEAFDPLLIRHDTKLGASCV